MVLIQVTTSFSQGVPILLACPDCNGKTDCKSPLSCKVIRSGSSKLCAVPENCTIAEIEGRTTMNMPLLIWVVTPCGFLGGYRRFGGRDGGSVFLGNIDIVESDYPT